MIRPTVSRAVWFRPGPTCGIPVSDQPLHATIVRVINDRLVNLLVVDGSDGTQYFKPAVQLVQHGDKLPNDGPFCVWPEVHRPATPPPANVQGPAANEATTLREPVIADQAEPGNGDVVANADASVAALPEAATSDPAPTPAPAQ